jgi:hypothetical protein
MVWEAIVLREMFDVVPAVEGSPGRELRGRAGVAEGVASLKTAARV